MEADFRRQRQNKMVKNLSLKFVNYKKVKCSLYDFLFWIPPKARFHEKEDFHSFPLHSEMGNTSQLHVFKREQEHMVA